ncbi:DUF4393 domain-containing protein [Lysinibacillus sp. FSL M8-0216]|uniref:DUF4393 domain-containing protein n=1 Tax=Lysinibacillus sp. FSL M8-0216 TaxID=2921619 RepID=UPI003159A917
MGEINLDPITTSAISRVTTEVVDVAKKSKEPKKTFDDIWYLTFGRLGLTADKLRFKHQVDLDNYKNSIIEKIESIPAENLQEPKMSIVGPALDAARFYIEEDVLREMFAEVISASFDKTKSEFTHHSFVEIIKQISPTEAKILKLFNEELELPIVRYEIASSKGSFFDLGQVIFQGFLDDLVSGDEYSIEISNLERLNLIRTNTRYYLKDQQKYDFFEQTTFYKAMLKLYEPQSREIKIIKGVLEPTPFGESFLRVCI